MARIGVVLPITQISQGSGLALNEAIRQLLISYLNGPVAEAISLDARMPVQAEMEAKQKECDFVFYSAVGRRQRSSGFARFMKTATPVIGMIPGGGATTTAAGAAGAATTDTVMKTAADLSSNIKAKDEISVEFKLAAQGGATTKIANVLKAKAKTDGDQVLSTLLAEAANTICKRSPRNEDATTPAVNMKLMIVEDNPQMRQIIRAVVADLADIVTECADGEKRSRLIRGSSTAGTTGC